MEKVVLKTTPPCLYHFKSCPKNVSVSYKYDDPNIWAVMYCSRCGGTASWKLWLIILFQNQNLNVGSVWTGKSRAIPKFTPEHNVLSCSCRGVAGGFSAAEDKFHTKAKRD